MKKQRFSFVQFSMLLILLLVLASWWFIFKTQDANLMALFSKENRMFAREFVRELVGFNEEHPAFLDGTSWLNALKLTFETLQMSVMAIGLATIGMLLTVVPAARTTAEESITSARRWYRWLVYGIIRVLYVFSRAVPELIWAMIIIFIFQPGILPGAIALALHNFGILGKLCAEVVEDLDTRPIRSLASSGAGKIQLLFYGIIPSVYTKFITYILYRWEVIIRTTIVVGFVGAGGLGQQFKLSMSWFHYTEVALYLMCYLILVWISDLISEGIRRAAR